MKKTEKYFPEAGVSRLLKRLQEARGGRKFKDFAMTIGLSSGHINKIERGMIPNLTPKVMYEISKLIGLSIEETYAIVLDVDIKNMMKDVSTPKECADLLLSKFSKTELKELVGYLLLQL